MSMLSILGAAKLSCVRGHTTLFRKCTRIFPADEILDGYWGNIFLKPHMLSSYMSPHESLNYDRGHILCLYPPLCHQCLHSTSELVSGTLLRPQDVSESSPATEPASEQLLQLLFG
jgi:hypothetical protein